MNHPRILGIGTVNSLVRLTGEQSFLASGYQGECIRKIFLNSDDHHHLFLKSTLTLHNRIAESRKYVLPDSYARFGGSRG